MSTDPNSLMDQAKCLDCYIPEGMEISVMIVLAAQIAGVSSDPAFLISQATCIDCNIPVGMQLPILIALLDKIANP